MTARRIGVDARALTPPLTGTGIYLRAVLRELAEIDPDTEYLCYSTRPLEEGVLPAGRFVGRLGRGPSSLWGSVWLQTGIKRSLLRDEVDVFWGALQIAPLTLIDRIPCLVTLHDLVFWDHPETMSWRNRVLLRRLALPSLEGAAHVVAISQATRDAAIERLGLESSRMSVAAAGVDPSFTPLPRPEAKDRLARDLGLDRPFLLAVGTLEPRKNLERLTRAVARLREAGRFDGDFVVVGGRGWSQGDLSAADAWKELGSRARLLGYVPQEQLVALYSAARAFVMPSLAEGFGMPVLEALSCAAAVACSDLQVFREVTQGVARSFDPTSVDSIAAALDELWNDAALRRELRGKAPQQAARFSWRSAAAEYLRQFDRLCDRSAGDRSSRRSS